LALFGILGKLTQQRKGSFVTRLAAFVLLTLLLIGCGSTPSGTTKIGFVALSQVTSAGITMRTASGSFFRYAQPIDVPTNADFLATDTCSVSVNGPSGPGTTPDPNPATSLDAGDKLTLKTGATLFTELPKQVSNNFIAYSSDPTTPLLPFPNGLTLDIPGTPSGFPAFSDVAVPSLPAEFTFSASSGLTAVSKSTTFSWTGQGSSSSSVGFSGSGRGADNKTVFFSCSANDDGSFAFPATTQSELESLGFIQGSVSSAERSSFVIQKQGEAGLLVNVFRIEVFDSAP
jgi:hypothetical protein